MRQQFRWPLSDALGSEEELDRVEVALHAPSRREVESELLAAVVPSEAVSDRLDEVPWGGAVDLGG